MKTVTIRIPKNTKLIVELATINGSIEEEEVVVYNRAKAVQVRILPIEGRTLVQTQDGMTCKFSG